MKRIEEILWFGKRRCIYEVNNMVGKSGLERSQVRRLIENGFFDAPDWLIYTYYLEEDRVHLNVTKFEEGIVAWLSATRESEYDNNDFDYCYVMNDTDFVEFTWRNKFVKNPKPMYELSEIAKSYFNGEEISEDDKEFIKRRLCFSW